MTVEEFVDENIDVLNDYIVNNRPEHYPDDEHPSEAWVRYDNDLGDASEEFMDNLYKKYIYGELVDTSDMPTNKTKAHAIMKATTICKYDWWKPMVRISFWWDKSEEDLMFECYREYLFYSN